MKYTIRQLTCPMEVIVAQRLLHDDYRYNQKWEPLPGNPSNARYLNGRLRDDFEDKAIWFGAYYKGELIGSLRIIPGELELARYTTFVGYTDRDAEVNRMVIRPEHQGSSVLTLLGLWSYFYLLRNGYSRMWGSPNTRIAMKSLRYGWKDTGIRFKYNTVDTMECALIYLPVSIKTCILLFIRIAISRLLY